MLNLCRRAVLRGFASLTAVAAPAAASVAVPAREDDGANGMVWIDGHQFRFGTFHFADWYGGKTTDRAVVIMDGRMQVRELAYYNSAGPDAHSGLVSVGPEKWERVPVLGRVVREARP